MNAELQYLKAIAETIKRLSGGKTGGTVATAKSSSDSISVTADVEAPGVAEALDTGLLTTVQEEEGGQTVDVRVSAVKTLGDRVLAELEAAFFTGTGAQRTTFFSQIHDELVRIKDLNHLGDLDDVTLNSEQNNQALGYDGTNSRWYNMTLGDAAFKGITTAASDIITSNGVLPTAGAVADKLAGYLPVTLTNAADKDVVMYDAPSGGIPAWKNVPPSSLLAPMMGSSQIGGKIGTDLKLMYWTGSQWSEWTLGKAAGADIASSASDIYSGNYDLTTASAVANKLAGYLPVTINNPSNYDIICYVNSVWKNVSLGTAALYNVTSSYQDIYQGSPEIPNGNAIYLFLQQHGLI